MLSLAERSARSRMRSRYGNADHVQDPPFWRWRVEGGIGDAVGWEVPGHAGASLTTGADEGRIALREPAPAPAVPSPSRNKTGDQNDGTVTKFLTEGLRDLFGSRLS